MSTEEKMQDYMGATRSEYIARQRNTVNNALSLAPYGGSFPAYPDPGHVVF
jgi:hypothetical protein